MTISGDFNPLSTGFDVQHLNLALKFTGLNQIVDVPTRNKGILDWCLVNVKDPVFEPIQLLQTGSSDHNAIVIKSYLQHSQNPDNKSFQKRLKG